MERRPVTLQRNGGPVDADWIAPADRPAEGAWIILHGLTRSGRNHAQLRRFTGALAATGSGVLVPEVPEWTALELAPHVTGPTLRAGLDWLERQDRPPGGGRGVIGFSFGAPHAIAASGDDDLRDRITGVVAFGGYCDLERTIRFQLTGEHEWEGRTRHHRPDPYGRWIVGGNHLPGIPEYADHDDVARALLELARRAGDAGVASWDPSLEAVKAELRASVAPERREVFDYLAQPGGGDPRGPEALRLARQLTEAAMERSPEMEVRPRLARVPGPVHLVHGRNDHLIPFTEAWRMGEALPPAAVDQVTVTALFGHSAQDRFPWARGVQETWGFIRAMNRLLASV